MSRTENIEQSIAKSKEHIQKIDGELIMEVVGVSMAVSQLRTALDNLERLLDKRQFEAAAQLGYNDISSEFIFLQRTLGGLQSVCQERDELISNIALDSGIGAFEEVEPFVMDMMQSSKELTDEERKENKKAARQYIADMKKRHTVVP